MAFPDKDGWGQCEARESGLRRDGREEMQPRANRTAPDFSPLSFSLIPDREFSEVGMLKPQGAVEISNSNMSKFITKNSYQNWRGIPLITQSPGPSWSPELLQLFLSQES